MGFGASDPVVFPEFAIDVATAAREAGFKVVTRTAGYVEPGPRAELFGALDAVALQVQAFRDAYANAPGLPELHLPELHLPTLTLPEFREALAAMQARAGERLHAVQAQAQDAIAQWHMPSREELAEKAAAMFVKTPSLDAIAARAHDLLIETVHARLTGTAAAKA